MLQFINQFNRYAIIATILLLTTSGMAKDYRGAEYRTIETVRYGRFEARIKSAPHPGTVSSLFTYHELGSAGVAEWNEIDIEFLGRYTDRFQVNTITDWQADWVQFVDLDYDPASEFHDYAFEWTPDYIAWFVDGEEVNRQTGPHVGEMNRYQKIMMNLWPSTNSAWVGNLNPSDLPIYAIYDWFTYSAYVPGTGSSGTGNNFVQLWHDDFNYWDASRWQKATHTWDGNNCDFTPANAVLTGGFLVLCLTTPSNTGYSGPPLSIDDHPESVPEGFQLSPAWPNPFNDQVNFSINNLKPGSIRIDIIDIQGEVKYSQLRSDVSSDYLEFSWEGKDDLGNALPSGSYICSVTQARNQLSQKILLLK